MPVSSGLRKVPALWNLLTLLEKRVAVLGWYVTWPAEEINGVVVTDNVMRPALKDRVHPPELQAEIDVRLEEVRALSSEETYPFGVALTDRRTERDLLIERLNKIIFGTHQQSATIGTDYTYRHSFVRH